MHFNACREREAEAEEQALLAQIRLDQQELSRLREARLRSKAEAESRVAAGEPEGDQAACGPRQRQRMRLEGRQVSLLGSGSAGYSLR